jgi:NAD(P)-dependent dehydrogenase (short-subunit alcohol dehydrogenase family)
MEWRNQVAVVTGGSRGIGRATARLLSQRGAAVCVNYAVNSDAARALVAEIASAGGRPAFGFRQPRSFRTTHANHVSGGPTRPWR